MESQRLNLSEDRQTIRGRVADEFSSTIPIDLVFNIFSRLPLKSIAICRCVSKQWTSILRRSDFTDLFFNKSLARPQLLFAGLRHQEVLLRSSPQSENPIATSNDLKPFHFGRIYDVSAPTNGLFCIWDVSKHVWVICNPSTGQYLTLPVMNTRRTRKRALRKGLLGYDPVEKQHKVLAITWGQNKSAGDHHVMTLGGTEKLKWRMSECGIHHYSRPRDGICINGVLYYIATTAVNSFDYIIICFDVRTEKYSVVKVMEPFIKAMNPAATLVNYNGKLASVMSQSELGRISGISTNFEMWVLEDPERHEWSYHVYKLPPMWKHIVAEKDLYIVGILTGTNEIVLSLIPSSKPGYVYYYNFEKETIKRVGVQGLRALDCVHSVRTFINHVEDVTLMNLF